MKSLYFPIILISQNVRLKSLISTIVGVSCQDSVLYSVETFTFNMGTSEFSLISSLCLSEKQELEKVLRSNLLKNSLGPVVILISQQIKPQKKSSLLIYNGKKILTCCIPPSEVTMQLLHQIFGEILQRDLKLQQK